MVATSSRGPSVSFQSIKPEIGAPGASVSAEAGTGSVETPFGGTSGATPVIAGAVALLQSASLAESGLYWAPWAVKALLMNNAEPNILINPVSQPGVLAPITRVGAGEVRVDRSLGAKAFAVVVGPPIEDGAPADIQAGVSFGYVPALKPGPIVMTRTIEAVNLTEQSRVFEISRTFRYADDQATGAVAVNFSSPTVSVPPLGQAEVEVTLTLDPTKLPNWTLNGGLEGGNGGLLRTLEFDGYIRIQDSEDTLTLPWHILPRKAADMAVSSETVDVGGSVQLSNLNGAVSGTTEVFALGGTSALDYPKPDAFGFNEALPDLKAAGIRLAGTQLEFALAFHHEWSHPATPVGGLIFIYVDLDGFEGLMLLTTEATGAGSGGSRGGGFECAGGRGDLGGFSSRCGSQRLHDDPSRPSECLGTHGHKHRRLGAGCLGQLLHRKLLRLHFRRRELLPASHARAATLCRPGVPDEDRGDGRDHTSRSPRWPQWRIAVAVAKRDSCWSTVRRCPGTGLGDCQVGPTANEQ